MPILPRGAWGCGLKKIKKLELRPQHDGAMMLVFEPTTGAIFIGTLFQPRQLATCPRAKVWLRRNIESVFDTLLQESVEPLLDATNIIDPRVVLLSIMLLILLRAAHGAAKRRFY